MHYTLADSLVRFRQLVYILPQQANILVQQVCILLLGVCTRQLADIRLPEACIHQLVDIQNQPRVLKACTLIQQLVHMEPHQLLVDTLCSLVYLAHRLLEQERQFKQLDYNHRHHHHCHRQKDFSSFFANWFVIIKIIVLFD